MIAGTANEPDSIKEPERPRWMEWVEKNAQPKTHHIVRPKREYTRWQKRGPMARKDWIRFYKWAAKNAISRHMRKAKKPKKAEGKDGKIKRTPKKLPLEQRLKRTEGLAEPRSMRDKYQIPETPDYPFIPHIRVKDPPPFPEKNRPICGAMVPRVFQHWELEADFWSQVRFQVSPTAQSYKPSVNILRMCVPRISPPLVPHCPYPTPPPEIIPKRRKFTPRQWRQHQKKLASYLARPRPLFNIDDVMYMQEVQARLRR